MATTTYDRTQESSLGKNIVAGALAGIGGGLVFGAIMGMMGMLPMVGMLVRQENAVVGFIVHLAISAFIGGVFGVFAARFTGAGATAMAGVVNGVVWWVLGALLLMPLFLGMNEMVFRIGQPQWMSLVGHVIYGLVTAFLFRPLRGRF